LNSAKQHEADLYIGLMSGTSLDGVDAVIAEFPAHRPPQLRGSHYLPYLPDLKARLLALHTAQENELHLASTIALELADLYANSVLALLDKTGVGANRIRAIGCHGQTIRHRPEAGYTLQLVNGARLAEKAGITSIVDFRSRDIAAGGQGAPLVPAFHAGALSSSSEYRVIVNIGGIANLTGLPLNGNVSGFDCGPGNLLMDAWAKRHLDKSLDEGGHWAAGGLVLPDLLSDLLSHPFFTLPTPKSAGREQFNLDWLQSCLSGNEAAQDVQATLLELTARGIADAARAHYPEYAALYVCGGGVHNTALMQRLATLSAKPVHSTSVLGIDPDWMEALAFAWLARQCLHGEPANLPAVTGACGPRILGAIYPA
jgi:anhydro-N-acetylmuramic acid kinase